MKSCPRKHDRLRIDPRFGWNVKRWKCRCCGSLREMERTVTAFFSGRGWFHYCKACARKKCWRKEGLESTHRTSPYISANKGRRR